jgi:hypothetical protein
MIPALAATAAMSFSNRKFASRHSLPPHPQQRITVGWIAIS